MTSRSICNCHDCSQTSIDTMRQFRKIQAFFLQQCDLGIYSEMEPQKPYYVSNSLKGIRKWYATKWYRCTVCGCLWEVGYPDFPTRGFVRKFEDGKYHERGY